MTSLMLVFAVLAVAVVVVGMRRRQEVRERTDAGGAWMDDETLRRIEAEGDPGTAFEEADDEPLDLEEIEREERRFWEESAWDEPEEF